MLTQFLINTSATAEALVRSMMKAGEATRQSHTDSLEALHWNTTPRQCIDCGQPTPTVICDGCMERRR